jgi:nucleotide-binding universal stress UspA family protein
MFRHILLPVDGAELSQKSVNECLALAKEIGAKVTALHVVPHVSLHVPVGFTSDLVQHLEKQREEEQVKIGEKMLTDLEASARANGVDCENVVVVGDNPYEEIIDNAEKRGCDLIMMASHGRRGLDAVLLGSETVKVLTHTKIPVLVVR